MNFIAAASPSYFAPAEHRRLSKTGQLETIAFDCKFKRLSKSEMKDLDARIKEQREQPGVDVDHFVATEVLLGWRVSIPAAEKGQPAQVKEIAFTPELLNEMEEGSLGFTSDCVRSFYLSTAPAKAAHFAEKN